MRTLDRLLVERFGPISDLEAERVLAVWAGLPPTGHVDKPATKARRRRDLLREAVWRSEQ
jgi:hypothetical protein